MSVATSAVNSYATSMASNFSAFGCHVAGVLRTGAAVILWCIAV